MKVIAKANDSTYICEVDHDEIEKLYCGSLEKLSVGQEVNLGQGYDLAVRIERACRKLSETLIAFDDACQVMASYAVALANAEESKT